MHLVFNTLAGPRFRDPAMEPAFRTEYRGSPAFFRLYVLAVTLPWWGFGLLDLTQRPEVAKHLLWHRFVHFTLFMAPIVLATFLPRLREKVDALSILGSTGLGIFIMHATGEFDIGAFARRFGLPFTMAEADAKYQFVSIWLAAILYGTGASTKFRFPSAVAMASAISVLVIVEMRMFRPSGIIAFISLPFVAVFIALFLSHQYLFERSARLTFALQFLLNKEKQRAEDLLLNVLPREIARRLQSTGERVVDQHSECSILFADIVGFTEKSSVLTPSQIVSLLNSIFTAFDALTDKYGVEKIKTIGDAYMAVCGLPRARPDHAQACASLALDMISAVAKSGNELKIRVGINSGPVVAGVIGTRKFIYDLWGDAVNMASRMESHGLPGRIQVSQATYEILRDEYLFEEQGEISVKGKGATRTYFLIGRK